MRFLPGALLSLFLSGAADAFLEGETPSEAPRILQDGSGTNNHCVGPSNTHSGIMTKMYGVFGDKNCGPCESPYFGHAETRESVCCSIKVEDWFFAKAEYVSQGESPYALIITDTKYVGDYTFQESIMFSSETDCFEQVSWFFSDVRYRLQNPDDKPQLPSGAPAFQDQSEYPVYSEYPVSEEPFWYESDYPVYSDYPVSETPFWYESAYPVYSEYPISETPSWWGTSFPQGCDDNDSDIVARLNQVFGEDNCVETPYGTNKYQLHCSMTIEGWFNSDVLYDSVKSLSDGERKPLNLQAYDTLDNGSSFAVWISFRDSDDCFDNSDLQSTLRGIERRLEDAKTCSKGCKKCLRKEACALFVGDDGASSCLPKEACQNDNCEKSIFRKKEAKQFCKNLKKMRKKKMRAEKMNEENQA